MQLALSKSLALAGLLGAAAACLAAGRPGVVSAQEPAAAPKPPVARGAAPARLALIVGVEHYAPSSPPTVGALEGCRADAESVRDTLVARFGFAPEDMRVLLDEQATHEKIVRAWREWLVPRAGPETEVVFWFSGHGARVPDASGLKGAERDGLDQTILAYDSRAGGEDGSYDISDDELNSLYALLARKTARLLVVVDACHSASGLRGTLPKGAIARARAAGSGKQSLDVQRLVPFWSSVGQDFMDDGDARRASVPTYVHVAACSESQEALEYSWTDKGGVRRTRGALSFFLGEALAHARPGATYREVAEEGAARLMRQIPGQTPCYEGALQRRLFEARFEEAPEGILARVQADGRLALEGGTLLGLSHGSELRLQDPAGKPVGLVQVEDAWVTHAIAKWSGTAPAEVPAVLRAFEQSRPTGGPVFALCVDDPQLAATLPAHQDVTRIAAPAPEAYLLARSGEVLTLLAPGGIAIWRDSAGAKLSPAELGHALDERWQKETRQRLLEELAPGPLQIEAFFRSPTPEELDKVAANNPRQRVRSADVQRLQKVAGSVYGARGRPMENEEIALAVLEVRNASKEELNLAVLSVMETREIRVVCPANRDTEFLLPAGEMHPVLVDVTCGRDWALDRPPRDRYVVIAKCGALNPWALESSATLRGGNGTLQLPALLAAGLEPRTTRGINRKVRVDVEKYGAATVDLLVRRP